MIYFQIIIIAVYIFFLSSCIYKIGKSKWITHKHFLHITKSEFQCTVYIFLSVYVYVYVYFYVCMCQSRIPFIYFLYVFCIWNNNILILIWFFFFCFFFWRILSVYYYYFNIILVLSLIGLLINNGFNIKISILKESLLVIMIIIYSWFFWKKKG